MKTYLFYLEIILVSILLLGCAGNTKKEADVEKASTTKQQAEELLSQSSEESKVSKEESEEVKEFYMSFLRGDRTAMKAVSYTEYNADIKGKADKEYNIHQLMNDFKKEWYDSEVLVSYALVDFGQDGTNQLLVEICAQQESSEKFYRTLVMNAENDKLLIKFAYDYGYRTSAVMYSNGYLFTGGSFGAGAHGGSYYKFNETGDAEKIAETYDYWGSYIDDMSYVLTPDTDDLFKGISLNDIAFGTFFYIPANSNEPIIFCAGDYSDGKAGVEEKKVVKALKKHGVEEKSEEYIDEKIASVFPVEEKDEVTFIPFE